jgi:prepilin peptidase CpaA
MLAVLWLDTTRYIIPNWLVGALLLVYAFAVFNAPHAVDWKMALAGAGIVLACGFVIFALKFMGGGDVKLLIALSLWVGFAHLLDFIFITSILGGVLSLLLWGGRKALPFLPRKPKAENLPRILQNGAPVPYGIAIAVAFLAMMWMGKVPVLS